MSILLRIGIIIVGIIVIIAAIVSRGKKRFMQMGEKERPAKQEDYLLYQRTKLSRWTEIMR